MSREVLGLLSVCRLGMGGGGRGRGENRRGERVKRGGRRRKRMIHLVVVDLSCSFLGTSICGSSAKGGAA